MVFPHPLAGEVLRHPSPLYGVLLEGILLFILLWCYAKKPRPPGAITGLFLSGYAIIRFIEEFFRAPDIQYGFIAWDWLTMGQLLSFPMLLAGGILLIFSAQKLPKNR
jgi:phosphatidylglycerol:prolipoprotein diacylglycerol transferase